MDILKVIVLGYVLGAIPFGYIAGKLYKIDITKHGSGNIGFTNVMRVIGIFPAVFVLFFDGLKGYLSVYYGYYLGGELLAVLGAIFSMAGHIWSIFIKFKGGRAVATGLGIILFLSPKITIGALTIFGITVFITRYVSLGSMLAAIFVPLGMFFLQEPLPYILFTFVGAVLVIFRHRVNIERLLQGKENKIGEKINPKGGPRWNK